MTRVALCSYQERQQLPYEYEQLISEIYKEAEQDELVDQQYRAPKRTFRHEPLHDETHQPEQHHRHDDRARMMR